MLNKKGKEALLNRILQSNAFVNSHVYQNLLTYLVRASIKNITPKEYTIATEVFHKGSDFDPSQDTIVRVYIYNLRKKLDHYYSHEGLNEDIRIELPKGHYELNFVLSKKPKIKTNLNRFFWIIALIILLITNLVYIYKYHFKDSTYTQVSYYKNDLIWANFLLSSIPKQIVLGDHFFFIKNSRSREKRIILRRDNINTPLEFNEYKAEKIERRNYVKLRYPMFPRNSVWPFADIIRLFLITQQNFQLNYSSNVTASEIANYNILFVGSFHTLASFEQTFRNSIFTYQVYPNILSYHDEQKDTLITYPEEGDPLNHHIDYGIVRKIPGPNKNIVFVFTSFHETGTSGMVKYLTEPKSLRELKKLLEKKYGYVPQYFEILFKTHGYDRTAYSTEIEHIHEINPDIKFW